MVSDPDQQFIFGSLSDLDRSVIHIWIFQWSGSLSDPDHWAIQIWTTERSRSLKRSTNRSLSDPDRWAIHIWIVERSKSQCNSYMNFCAIQRRWLDTKLLRRKKEEGGVMINKLPSINSTTIHIWIVWLIHIWITERSRSLSDPNMNCWAIHIADQSAYRWWAIQIVEHSASNKVIEKKEGRGRRDYKWVAIYK